MWIGSGDGNGCELAKEFAGKDSRHLRKDGERASLTNRHEHQHTFREKFLHDNTKACDTAHRAVNSFGIVQ